MNNEPKGRWHRKLKFGKFRISRSVIFDEPQQMAIIFAHVLPVKIEWDWNGIGTYTAWSDWFDEIEECTDPPMYEAHFTSRVNGPLSIEFKRATENINPS